MPEIHWLQAGGCWNCLSFELLLEKYNWKPSHLGAAQLLAMSGNLWLKYLENGK